VTVRLRITNNVGSVFVPDKVLLPKNIFTSLAEAAETYNLTSLAGRRDMCLRSLILVLERCEISMGTTACLLDQMIDSGAHLSTRQWLH
jgi:hypothetical protein